ncbi:MAG: hypothetical protein DI628_08605 [Blastochloris viridis]|uniref:Uncharacterized protein n=1 Tax=Blastochloris viridis TaxID=1079 RepID=A0A6N4R0Z2_BLAVI|nr:MAG: hypothetical protein DI628_08605 [Blastochloris viridis]
MVDDVLGQVTDKLFKRRFGVQAELLGHQVLVAVGDLPADLPRTGERLGVLEDIAKQGFQRLVILVHHHLVLTDVHPVGTVTRAHEAGALRRP